MNCQQCHRLLYLTQRTCQCGWKRPNDTLPAEVRHRSEPQADTARAMAEREAPLVAWVERYMAKHPGTTRRDACRALLKKKGLIEMLPDALKHG